MSKYRTRVKRWEHGWEIHIDGVGVTQSRKLVQAIATAQDYVQIMTGEPDAEIEISIDISDAVNLHVEESRAATRTAAEASRAAAAKARAVVAELKAAGITRPTEIAIVLGVSQQRASQLAKDAA